ncbi:MAG: VWA domain-containing protein [Planctomycetota bacterium]|jgi:hypothetical protein
MGAALALLLLLADATDQAFLLERVASLGARYNRHARQQSPRAIRARLEVLSELAHLPFEGEAREKAGRLLARVVAGDRSYRVRADAARAIGRVGTGPALRAMYRTLFGPDGRTQKFALLHAVLPEALAGVRHPDDLEWISTRILKPAAAGEDSSLFRQAGPLRHALVALTLDGVARARARALGPEAAALAGAGVVEVRAAALRALAALEFMDPVVTRSLTDADERVRAAAAGYPRLTPAEVRTLLADASRRVRRAAIRGRATRPPPEAVPPLLARLAQEEDAVVRLDLLDALNRLTGREFGDNVDLWRSWWEASRNKVTGAEPRDRNGRVYFFQVGLRTERVVFVIDVSASMSREDEQGISRLEHAARALGKAVQTLSPTARFRLLAFAADLRRFPVRGREEGDRTDAAEATRWLRGLAPAGATNTYGALMHALTDRLAPDTVVLLSDGNPYRCLYKGRTYTEHEQILAEVRRVNEERQVRIHTVALLSGALEGDAEDAASAAEFLRRLARENRGEFREVR